MIETQIVPFMSAMSELLVGVCEELATAKVSILTDQQQTIVLTRDRFANSQLLPRLTVFSLLIPLLFLLDEFRCKRVFSFERNWNMINNY
jgi:hypothetical protein